MSYSAALQTIPEQVMQESVAVRSWHLLVCALPTAQPGKLFTPMLNVDCNRSTINTLHRHFTFCSLSFFPPFLSFFSLKERFPQVKVKLCAHICSSCTCQECVCALSRQRSSAPSFLLPLMLSSSDCNINMFTEHGGKALCPGWITGFRMAYKSLLCGRGRASGHI